MALNFIISAKQKSYAKVVMLILLRFLLTVDMTIWRFQTFRKPSIMVEDLLYHSNRMCREMTSPNFLSN